MQIDSFYCSFRLEIHHLLRTIHSVWASRWARILIGNTLIMFAVLDPCSGQNLDLTQKSLEDLMNIKVTSVSKKEQKTSQAAAAVFVISRDDILRSGALNIPDLLRMVPGLDVAQIDASKWAITARGFNGQYSNNLLVLVDGRTIYISTFAGVYWDSQNVAMRNIERIEVIRGPGAAVWGSNAVNGVINIITKNARETQGGYLSASAGNTSGRMVAGYGGTAHGFGAYRIFGTGLHFTSLPTSLGLNGQDTWSLGRVGFRADSVLSAKDSLTTEAEVYRGDAGELASVPVSLEPPVTATVALRDRYSGWNVLTRWNRTLSARADTSLQIYFDRITRGDSTYDLALNTFDVNFQQHFSLGARQDVVWGLGYRTSSDGTTPSARIVFAPNHRILQLFNLFAQDEVAIQPDRLHLSLGARVEHNDYTGFDFQPTVRLAWTPDSKNMVWAAISGAERTPARSDTDLRVNYAAFPGPGGAPALVSLLGDPNHKNERLTAFEAGYRNDWTNSFSLDFTMFYNRYRDLASVEPGAISFETSPAPAHLLIPSYLGDGLHGETHGIELFADWKVTTFWTLSPGYSFFSMHLHPFAGSQDFTGAAGDEGGAPDHQAQLRSSARLPHNLQWNTSAYFVNRLPAVSIPSYTRLDTDLIWHTGERVSISVVGQNLLKDLHPEYAGPSASVESDLMRRAAYAKIMWSF
jgi:iron complex outermembrane receptor protein